MYVKLSPLRIVKANSTADSSESAARQASVIHFAACFLSSRQIIAQMIGRKILKKGKFCTNEMAYSLLSFCQVLNNLAAIRIIAKNTPIEIHIPLKLKSISYMRLSKTLFFT